MFKDRKNVGQHDQEAGNVYITHPSSGCRPSSVFSGLSSVVRLPPSAFRLQASGCRRFQGPSSSSRLSFSCFSGPPSVVRLPSSAVRLPSSGCRPSSVVCRRFQGPPSVVRRPSSGFTLIELLVVMVIAVVIMAVSLPSFLSMGRGAGMRTAVNNVRSTVSLSRQWAITHREEITFMASPTGLVWTTNNQAALATNDHACYYAVSAFSTGLIQRITDLPLDVTFDDPNVSATNLTFKTDGGLTIGAVTEKIVLVDKKNSGVTKTISINGLTGGIKVE